jgi:hypothetical protein
VNRVLAARSGAARPAVIAGFLIAGAIILAIGFLVPGPTGAPDDRVPPIRVLAPADGDTLQGPVTVRFRTTSELSLKQEGWTAGELHLHAMVDELEIMPAAADVAGSDSVFEWRLPALEPGDRRLYLTWAGRHHGNLRGVTDTIRFHLLP